MLEKECNFFLGYEGTIFFWGGAAYDKHHAKDLFNQLLFSYERIWKQKSEMKLPDTSPVIMGYLTPQLQIEELPLWLPDYLIHLGSALYEIRF